MERIYARPTINGEYVKNNIDFKFDGSKAKIAFVIAEVEDSDILKYVNSTVRIGFSVKSGSVDIKTVIGRASLTVSKIDSLTDNFTYIELLAEDLDTDKSNSYFREL